MLIPLQPVEPLLVGVASRLHKNILIEPSNICSLNDTTMVGVIHVVATVSVQIITQHSSGHLDKSAVSSVTVILQDTVVCLTLKVATPPTTKYASIRNIPYKCTTNSNLRVPVGLHE